MPRATLLRSIFPSRLRFTVVVACGLFACLGGAQGGPTPKSASAAPPKTQVMGSGLAAESPAARAARARLSDRFAMHQTQRFVLFSDATDVLTSQSAGWAERAYDEFERFANECDLKPGPLQHKLVCILFEKREEYLAFAKSNDGMSNISFTGYYSPKNDRVVFSVEPERAPQRKVEAGAARTQKQPAAPSKPVLGFDTRGLEGQNEPEPHAAHNHQLLDVPCDSAAKCVHETIHQLMFHTRVMTPDVQYPLWICEGLATAFETATPSLPFGPDVDFAPRRDAFQSLLRRDQLIPLRDLAVLTQVSADQPRITRVVYQQSYALVTWMSRERKEQLRDYLSLMRRQDGGRMSAAKHLRLFEQAFGDVDVLEQAWLNYERTVRLNSDSR